MYLRSSYPFADIHYPRECLLDIFEGTEVQYNVRVAVYVVRVRVLVYCSTKVAVCTCAVSYHSIYPTVRVQLYNVVRRYFRTRTRTRARARAVHVHVHVQNIDIMEVLYKNLLPEVLFPEIHVQYMYCM